MSTVMAMQCSGGGKEAEKRRLTVSYIFNISAVRRKEEEKKSERKRKERGRGREKERGREN